MPKTGQIEKHGKQHWYIEALGASGDPTGDRSVTWQCSEDTSQEFVVMFPSRRNPLEGGIREIYSAGGVATATVRSYGGDIFKGAEFHYCILLIGTRKEDSVTGPKSPPTMVIE